MRQARSSPRPKPPTRRRAADGGAPTFQEIYDAYRPKLRSYLTHMVGADEAEDLTQEVLLKVLQGLPGFKGQSSVSTWLYRIATNAALDRLRRPSLPRAPSAATAGFDEAGDAVTDDTPSADEQLLRDELRRSVLGLVDRLPEHYRRVIVLGELKGWKNAEIASHLGVGVETVKTWLHRARARLRAELNRDRELGRGLRLEPGLRRRGARPPISRRRQARRL